MSKLLLWFLSLLAFTLLLFLFTSTLLDSDYALFKSRYSAARSWAEARARSQLNCSRTLSLVGDAAYSKSRAKKLLRDTGAPSLAVLERYRGCDARIRRQIEITANSTPSRANLAFSIILHRDAAILEHQLLLLFRPSHAFCLHVDAKADTLFRSAVEAMVKCYKKVVPQSVLFLAPKPISIYWGHISLLDGDLKCVKLLHARDSRWSHVFTLAGSELPRYPLPQLEDMVLRLEGSSYVSSSPMPTWETDRITVRHELYKTSRSLVSSSGEEFYPSTPRKTELKKSEPPPHNLMVFKGSKNVILNRTMADFVLRHPVAKDFRAWLEDTSIPDESFYATLIRVRRVEELMRRKWSGVVQQDKRAAPLPQGGVCSRYSHWQDQPHNSAAGYCFGVYKRDICNFSLLDLPGLLLNADSPARGCFVLNKFDLSVDPLAVTCLTEHILHAQRTGVSIM